MTDIIKTTPVITPPHSNARAEIERLQKDEKFIPVQLNSLGQVWDYSFARPNLAGTPIVGVCRYLDYLPNGKVINRSELNQILSLGKTVLFNWENGATDMRGGANTGAAHGKEANRQLDAMGIPKNVPIIYSADWDVQGNEYAAVEAYLRAASAQGRPAGVYGKNDMVHQMMSRGAAVIGWVTLAWQYGQAVSPLAHLYQDGVNSPNGTDHNIILKANWGAYPSNSINPVQPTAPTVSPINSTEQDDMTNPSAGLFQINQIDTFWVDQKGNLVHHWFVRGGPVGPDPSGWNHEVVTTGLQPLCPVLGPFKWTQAQGDGYIHLYALNPQGEQIEAVYNLGEKNDHWLIFNQ